MQDSELLGGDAVANVLPAYRPECSSSSKYPARMEKFGTAEHLCGTYEACTRYSIGLRTISQFARLCPRDVACSLYK